MARGAKRRARLRRERGGEPRSIAAVDATTSLAGGCGGYRDDHPDRRAADEQSEDCQDQCEKVAHDKTPRGRFEPLKWKRRIINYMRANPGAVGFPTFRTEPAYLVEA